MHTCQEGGYCDVCKELRECAMALRAAILKMKLCIKYNGEFNVERESWSIAHRVEMWHEWMFLSFYNEGYTFDDFQAAA